MKLKDGFYWYRGPFFNNGEKSDDSEGWTVVNVWDGDNIALIGTDWDAHSPESQLMAKHGEFVRILTPTTTAWFSFIMGLLMCAVVVWALLEGV